MNYAFSATQFYVIWQDKMKNIIIGAIIFGGIIFLVALLKGPIRPDLTFDGGYEPCRLSGHPLWQDC